MTDPWEFMGVKPGDTEADLARAFRQRMFECHPDRGRDNGDEAKASQLSRIYESFKRLLVDDGTGVKRLRPPKPRRRVGFHPGARPIGIVIIQGGPGVSTTFTTTTW